MCGIAGWIGFQGESQEVASHMARALRHRGPDSHGIWSTQEATLVHTRLSIIDLSAAGAQPLANEDGTVLTVFNGEIYNHRELRRDLENRGHRFKGHSDSEILPHLYEEVGSAFVDLLRGMFAVAIYDTRTRTLILARDRFGIKPLYYAPENQRLVFASEINALLHVPGIDTRPDTQAIYDVAALHYIPAPETFYCGIQTLQAGEILEARANGDGVCWKARRYHRWSTTPDPQLTMVQAVDRAEALVATAVRRQLESEVPLGALLSGGIDSSLVSSAAQSTLGGGLRTFNVRFADQEYDETWAALAVARHIGSTHTTLDMNGNQGTWNAVTELLLHAGQPFADTSLFAVNAVCRLMRRHVTVALSGDGGDEGFGGYNFYWQIARIARLQVLPPPVWHVGGISLAMLARARLIPAHLPQRLTELAGTDDVGILEDLFSWVRKDELDRLCLDEKKVLPIRRLFEPQWEHHLPANACRLDKLSAYATEANVRMTLPNDFLFKVDIASMRESLEVRVPMLDEDLFSLGLTLPHSLKVRGRTCKRVLRSIAERWLPTTVARKPKWGFGVPVDRWVDSEFKFRLRDTLLGPASRLSDVFRPEVYRPMVEAFCDGRVLPGISRQGLYQRAVMFLSVHLALERHAA